MGAGVGVAVPALSQGTAGPLTLDGRSSHFCRLRRFTGAGFQIPAPGSRPRVLPQLSRATSVGP